MVGGKEIEVMGVISADDFNSGRCFQAGIGTHDMVQPALLQTNVKPFCKPFKRVCQPNTKENMLKDTQIYKPRHDPNASSKIQISKFLSASSGSPEKCCMCNQDFDVPQCTTEMFLTCSTTV